MTIGYPQYLLWRERIAARATAPSRPGPPVGPVRLAQPAATSCRWPGAACRKCGALQFPLPRVCYQCHAVDEFEPVSASGQTARIVTFTVDRLAYSPSPPRGRAVVDFDGGGRAASAS